MVSQILDFLPQKWSYLKSEKSIKILTKNLLIWYMVGLCRFNFSWMFVIWKRLHFLLLKTLNRLLFSIIIFLCFVSYLLKFQVYKNILFTKLTEIIWGIRRTLPFYSSCPTTRVISSEASPLFFRTPLIA